MTFPERVNSASPPPAATAASSTTRVTSCPQLRGRSWNLARSILLIAITCGVILCLEATNSGGSGGSGGSSDTTTGSGMAIGLFTNASALSIPNGSDLVQTSGYSEPGKGQARYVFDAGVDAAYAAANPRISFVSANG